MKCPCCRIKNALDEAVKHPSLTSVSTFQRSWHGLLEAAKDGLLLSKFMGQAVDCPAHHSPVGFVAFVEDVHTRQPQILTAANTRLAKIRERRFSW